MYRWAAKNAQDFIIISPAFDDFDEAHDAYTENMQAMQNEDGTDLSAFKWRGVFSQRQIEALVQDRDPHEVEGLAVIF